MNRHMDWTLIEVDDDTYDLVKGRRQLLSEATLTQIKKYMRRNLATGERVVLVEKDGYRREVTRWFHSNVRRRPC